MVCLEVKFNEKKRYEMEQFLIKTNVLFFDKCFERIGCLKLYVAECDKIRVIEELKNHSFVERVRNIMVEEVLV